MATLAVQSIVRTGLAPTYAAAAAGGDKIPRNTGGSCLHIKNTGASTTLTIVSQATPGPGEAQANETVTIPATTGDKLVGPFPKEFEDASGLVEFTYSQVTGVTVACIDLAD